MFCLNCWKIFIVQERKFNSVISSSEQLPLSSIKPDHGHYSQPGNLLMTPSHVSAPSKVFSCGTFPTPVALIAKSNSEKR